jgi:hypothetical protein
LLKNKNIRTIFKEKIMTNLKKDNEKSKVVYNVKSVFDEKWERLSEKEKIKNFNKKLLRCILEYEKNSDYSLTNLIINNKSNNK